MNPYDPSFGTKDVSADILPYTSFTAALAMPDAR